jgi:hypothetical protein
MYKKTPLLVVLFLGLIVAFSACNKSTNSILQAFFSGATHKFTANQVMYVYQTANQSTIYASEPGTNDSITLVWGGTTTGSYTNPISTYVVLASSGKYYYSNLTGGSASINITSMDNSKMWAQGNFTATMVNAANTADVINLTQGSLSLKYQF